MRELTMQDLLDMLKQIQLGHIQQIHPNDRIIIKKELDRISQLISITNQKS